MGSRIRIPCTISFIYPEMYDLNVNTSRTNTDKYLAKLHNRKLANN